MNYPLTSSGQVHAAAELAEAVADRYGCVGVINWAATGTAALLDQTERDLSSRRIRCVRVQGPASGGLASRGLIAQIVARPDPAALTDADLKAGFITLTEPGEGFRRVALLVAEAHSLLPSALRTIQLARQASPAKLCVVLAGKPSLLAALEGEDFAPLRSAMHVMELAEAAGPGLFDRASAMAEPPATPGASRRGGSSPLVRLGLAAMIVPIVGLIWWRHLPPSPAAAVPPPDAPSTPAVADTPAAADAPSVPAVIEPPVAPPSIAAPTERAGEPAPSEPGPAAQAGAAIPAEPDPAPPVAPPGPPASEATAPEAPAESSAADAAKPPAAAEPPPALPPAALPPAADAAEPPAAVAAEPPPAAAPELSQVPTQETDLAEPPAPKPAAPDAGPPTPDPAIAAKPPPHGTLTVTAALPAHAGARRAAGSMATPPAAAAIPAARPAEDRPSLADERRCRDIVLRAQLGKDPSDADKQFLRNGCRSG